MYLSPICIDNKKNQKKTSFKSLANPIKPFKLATNKGKLLIEEFNPNMVESKKTLRRILNFMYKNYATAISNPIFHGYNLPKERIIYKRAIERGTKRIMGYYKGGDKDITLLVAKNRNNKIQGMCLSYGLKRIPNADKRVCYIEDIVVNKNLRGQGVGKAIIEKTLESAKSSFSDVFLEGELKAVGFYKKLGFKELNSNIQNQKEVIDKITDSYGHENIKYVKLLTKPLQTNKPRWYDIK